MLFDSIDQEIYLRINKPEVWRQIKEGEERGHTKRRRKTKMKSETFRKTRRPRRPRRAT